MPSTASASALVTSESSTQITIGGRLCRVSNDQQIKYVCPNPKAAGGQAHARYSKYMRAKTIGQALKLGAAIGDFEFDLRNGFASCPRLVAFLVAAVAVVREDRNQ